MEFNQYISHETNILDHKRMSVPIQPINFDIESK